MKALLVVAILTTSTTALASAVPQSGAYLDLNGSKVYYEECGSGPTIVLLHDGLVHAVTWDGVWSALCQKYQVVRYDRRGYGRSDPPRAQFSPTDDLYQLLKHLQVSHAVIVGSSSGGALAIDFALEHPQAVDGLFLVGPVLHGMRDSAHFTERGDKNNEPMSRGDLKAVAENWSQDRFLIAGENPVARKKLYDALVASPQNLQYRNRFETPLSPPAARRLSEIKVPTLIVAGEADIADVHAYSGAINAGIRESARVVIAGAGHFIQLEKPEEIITRLNRFVPKVERAPATVSTEILKSYEGQYKLGDTILMVSVEGNHLVGRISAGEYFFFPESPSKFFARLQDASLEFEKDANGRVIQLVISQGGSTTKWTRL